MMREAVVNFCADIGRDPLLVQGAGGNVSWKENNTLWIKASGTWLSEAGEKDIFVPVDLSSLINEIGKGNFAVKPTVVNDSALRPSIETILHALMPHKIVVHLHAVEILAVLVRKNVDFYLKNLLGKDYNWVSVSYMKPGEDLAYSVSQALMENKCANIVFLKNHGVVIGGDSTTEVLSILTSVINRLKSAVKTLNKTGNHSSRMVELGYQMHPDPVVQGVVHDDVLVHRLKVEWVLYPDHVVFLGAQAFIFEHIEDFLAAPLVDVDSEIVFIRNYGVFVHKNCSEAKLMQLKCYIDVVLRQDDSEILSVLGESDIGALLNWDAERYRINMLRMR